MFPVSAIALDLVKSLSPGIADASVCSGSIMPCPAIQRETGQTALLPGCAGMSTMTGVDDDCV